MRNQDAKHARCRNGLNARFGIFDSHALGWRYAQTPGCLEVDVRRGLAVRHLVTRGDSLLPFITAAGGSLVTILLRS